MEYIYDIVLNFNDCYYEFYEWNSKDKIINVKKIPVYRINDIDYLSFKYNIVRLILKNIRSDGRRSDICKTVIYYRS